MNQYVILIGLCLNLDLGETADRELSDRRQKIYELVFSLGPAWQGPQSSILLLSEKGREDIVALISPLVGGGDFVGVMEIAIQSITSIGLNSDEEGLDSVFPNVRKMNRW